MSEVIEAENIITSRTNLESLLDKAIIIQNDCSDFSIPKVNENTLRMNDLAGITYVSEGGEIRRADISPYALSQLCNKIGVPARYIDKCIKAGMLDLAQDNITSWVSDYNGSFFVREYKNKIRGILSSKFTTLDTPDIIEVLKDTLPSHKVKGYYLNEERFHLRLVTDRLDIPNEDLFGGISVDSSDVGRSALNVNFFLYKQVCTNGLCLAKGKGEIFRQKHIGITKEAFLKGLQDNLVMIPEIEQELTSRIKFARESGEVDFMNSKSVESVIDLIKAKTGLTEDGAKKVVSLFEYRVHRAEDFRYENNTWGLVNSITEFSQNFALDRRLELEKSAGSLIA